VRPIALPPVGAHSLKERLARWLLMMRDRSDDDALAITQTLLAQMLGVQRPTVTQAISELERAGVIEHGRQQVTIRDRGECDPDRLRDRVITEARGQRQRFGQSELALLFAARDSVII
jgi:Mn-dependent DtxR family transcriptional regulator